jgi:hypothetical protein
MDALATIAKRYGADIMVKGTAVGRWSAETESYGVQMTEYVASAGLEAYRPDTQELITRVKFDKKGSATGEAAALENAYKKLGETLSKGFLKELLNAWYFRFQHGDVIEIELVIKAATEKKLKEAQKFVLRFSELLKEIEGIEEVTEMDFNKGEEKAIQKLSVKTKISAEDIKKKLILADLEGAGFTLEVTSATKAALAVTLEIEE